MIYQTFKIELENLFVSDLKNNISSRFTSQDIVSSMSIFDPRKLPIVDSPGFTSYGDSSINTLIQHYGEDQEAQTTDGEEYLKKALISPLNGKPFISSFLSTQRKI